MSSRRIASNLRSARERSGLSLRELARRVQISAAAMSRVETGKCVPSEGLLRDVCAVVGTDFDSLMKKTGRLPEDVVRYITRTPGVLERLRREMDAA